MTNTIECPECGNKIEIQDALKQQIALELREQIQQEKQKEINVLNDKLKQAQNQQADIEKERRELKERENQIDFKIQQGITKSLELEKPKIEKQVKEEQQALMDAETQRREEKIRVELAKEYQNKISKAQEFELKYLKGEREFKEYKNNTEIENQRKINQKIEQMQQKHQEQNKELESKYARELKEREKALDDVNKKLEQAQESVNQKSQQLQGEAWELEIEEGLKRRFPMDTIYPVKTGTRGADVIQEVMNKSMASQAGKIIWEMKNTQNFGKDWIAKLKDDQRSAGADIAILASIKLPDEIDGFGLMDDVWVCSPAYVYQLASALRMQLIKISSVKISQEGKGQKITMMYDYLNGDQFRNHIKTMVEKFVALRDELTKEQRSVKSRWNRQAKHIEMMEDAITGMYGDMQGIAGNELQTLTDSAKQLDYNNADDNMDHTT